MNPVRWLRERRVERALREFVASRAFCGCGHRVVNHDQEWDLPTDGGWGCSECACMGAWGIHDVEGRAQ